MDVATVTTADGSLLRAVRGVIVGADETLLCVAFVKEPGVHLVLDELEAAAKRGTARLLVTTVFDPSSGAALGLARRHGVKVRVLNPGSGTYHPKVYLGRRAAAVGAVIGSANLTGGLVSNVEIASELRGGPDDQPLARAWQWAESLWNDSRARDWAPDNDVAPSEGIEPELLALIRAAAKDNPKFYTLGPAPRINRVSDVTASGVYVETARSQERKGGAEVVEAWMLNLAWEVLRSRGTLTNRELLEDLRVHRSSAVCAILARLPGVTSVGGRGITLRWQPVK